MKVSGLIGGMHAEAAVNLVLAEGWRVLDGENITRLNNSSFCHLGDKKVQFRCFLNQFTSVYIYPLSSFRLSRACFSYLWSGRPDSNRRPPEPHFQAGHTT